jgi:hypothetical protein
MPGLKHFRLDLHTHTPASKCYRYKQHTPEQIVQAALERQLAAIAITDHNTAEWIDAVKQAAEGTGLVIFPGVEISMSEGFHLVALFDPHVDQKHIEGFLGGIDIDRDEYGKQEAVCEKSAYDVVKTIHARQGLAVLAHIDRPKGAFYELVKPKDGGKVSVPVHCSRLFNEAEYDAVECADGHLPDGFDETHQIKRVPAFYLASDNPDSEKPTQHSLDGLGKAYCWFHLDEINLEGLRQCLADPEVRIRRPDDLEVPDYPRIVSMAVGDTGFLRTQTFEFHSGLNSIIGGKGVGKSLAIEFLRFGLEQPSTDPNLAADVASKLDKCLEPGNGVVIIYQTADGSQYQIERTFLGIHKSGDGLRARGEHRCVNAATRIEYAGDIPDMFPILAYSQTEIIKIAENKEAQLQLVDRFIDTRQVERSIADTQALLRDNDRQLDKAIQARGQLDVCERQIKTLWEQIDAISRTLSDPLFDAMKAAERKRAVFEDRQRDIAHLQAAVRGWQGQIVGYPIEALPDELAGDGDLRPAQAAAEVARNKVLAALRDLTGILGGPQQAIDEALAAWLPQFVQTKADYDALLKTIGGDRAAKEFERQQLEAEKTRLEVEAKGLRGLATELPNTLKTRDGLLDGLERAYRSLYEVRKTQFDHLTELSGGKLNLTLAHAADFGAFEGRLSDLLKGGPNAPSVSDRRRIASTVMPRRLVQIVLDRDEVYLASEAGISELWASRAIEKLWSHSDFTEVLSVQHDCYPGDVPSIQFRKEGGQYDELSHLSVGQKCTALLIIALCDGTMPIVIDQPEDALDIVSVWEDIAKQLRRGKRARQFILTTHNSTVAVSADSDQFIVLEAGATAGKVVAAGAIDRPEVRAAVIKHLEGGKVPYKLRSLKYNIT